MLIEFKETNKKVKGTKTISPTIVITKETEK
jgi:hypothetical protein